MLKLKHRMYLQAFAEEPGSVGDTGDMNGSMNDPGLASQTDEEEDDLFSYREEPEETPVTSTVSPNESGDNAVDEWQTIREKYKDRIGEEIQGAVQKRFKNQTAFEDQYNSLVDGLGPLFMKYGLKGNDIEGLKNALAKDDSLLEDMAYDEGTTPEQIRRSLQERQENERLRREVEKYKEEQERREAEAQAMEDYNKWLKEAEELKNLYPNFDLARELENEDFVKDLMNSGKSMQHVYESMHLQEIMSGAIQTAVQKTREAVTNNIRSRGMRPPENGSRMGSVSVKKNVNDLTDKDIERIMARVKAGEIISF